MHPGILLLTASFFGVALAQEGWSDYQCGVPELANEIKNADFDTIHTDYYDLDWNDFHDMLVPKKMYWHIYAIPDNETPRFSAFPDGMVEAKVSGGKLEFKQHHDFLKDLGYSKGDRIKVAINVFVPVSKLRNLRMDGVDQSIEVVATDESLFADLAVPHNIDVKVSGVDSGLYVTAPFSVVKIRGSGVENRMDIEAASGSSVDLSGVNQDVHFKSDYLSEIRMSGVDQTLLLEGDYKDAKLSGVDIRLRINGPNDCSKVDDSGVDTDCQTTTETVSISQLSCLADTKVIRSMGLSIGAWIGILVAIVVAVGFCIGLCVCCCCAPSCCRRRRDLSSKYPSTATASPPPPALSSPTEEHDIIEAEVIGVEQDEDPEQPAPQQPTVEPQEKTTSRVNAQIY